MLSDYSIFDFGSESGYVRADKPDSALVRSFNKDRIGTVAAFKFMPSVTLWSIEDEKPDGHDGMELLKTGPMNQIRFRETHICPVGEECPDDIVKRIGRPKRCGICPLAMKSIDHLPAIGAKRNQLVERIRFMNVHRERMESAGEPAASLDAVWDEIQLDINELLGWKFSEEVLQKALADAAYDLNAATYIHVDSPEIVRRHLRLVTKPCNRTEFLLQRLAESCAYPSMSSPQVQMTASVLRRRLSAGDGLDDLAALATEADDVLSAASLIGSVMRTRGIGMNDVARLVDSAARAAPLVPLLLSAEARDGK